MASTQTWSEGNGSNAGTETTSRAESNWKNIDDSTTAYSSSPITAGSNSYHKVQAVKFGGTFNTLSSLSFYANTAQPADSASSTANTRVKASVLTSTTGATPATAAIAGAYNNSTGDIPTSAGSLTANFVATGTWASAFAAGTATLTSSTAGYSQPLRTQLLTGASAAPGDISSVTITASWTES